jgi:hypothetical protein
MNVTDWLCDGDAAIRWQTFRDLAGASPAQVNAARARVANEGLAAEILAQQQSDGAWRCPGEPAWLTTLFTLQLLRATGVDPADPKIAHAMQLAETNLRWNIHEDCWDIRSPEFGGNDFFEGEEEPCINGGVLAFGSYFGHPNEKLARRLLSEQLSDGGWNCEAPKNSSRSSYHTTICVLEGLLEYENATRLAQAPDSTLEVAAARHRAENYLLERALFRRRSTGDPASAEFLEFAFPPRYHYDILRALDYFRASGAPADPRMSDAVAIIKRKQQADGRWLLDRSYNEALTVSTGEEVGQPSRWNTLRALRVLQWFAENRRE